MGFDWNELGRLLAACVAGAIVGFERELHDKPAGLRTNVMICLGAALFTLLSFHVAGMNGGGDPGRIAAQIVTGVGFLGAGAIIQLRGHVIGLTTAATIWLVASIGMAFGAGVFDLGAVATVLTTAVLLGLSMAERYIAVWRNTARFQVEIDEAAELTKALVALLHELGLDRKYWRINKSRDGLVGLLKVVGPEPKLEELQNRLMIEPGVKSLQRL